MWSICGSSMHFSSQDGLKKVTLSENLLLVHVCGHGRPKDLWVKIGTDVLHQILFWGLKNVEAFVIFTPFISSWGSCVLCISHLCVAYFCAACSVFLAKVSQPLWIVYWILCCMSACCGFSICIFVWMFSLKQQVSWISHWPFHMVSNWVTMQCKWAMWRLNKA